MSLEPALRARIEAVLAAHPVVLLVARGLAAPFAGTPDEAVGALDAAGATYGHVNVLADPEIREGIKVFGDWPTIPQLYIKGEFIGGSDIMSEMYQAGELQKKLEGIAAAA